MKYAIFIKGTRRTSSAEYDIWEVHSEGNQTLFSEKEFLKLYPKLFHTHGKDKVRAFREVDVAVDTKLKVTDNLQG